MVIAYQLNIIFLKVKIVCNYILMQDQLDWQNNNI